MIWQRTLQTISIFIALSPVTLAQGTWVLNNPYPKSEANQNIYYTSFSEQPKTLDPAKSYSSNEYQFTGQIYEPPLQYDYLKRPYQLVTLTALSLPLVEYFDSLGKKVDVKNKEAIARSVYTISIKPGIYYQPHPAFAKEENGKRVYHDLSTKYLDNHDINSLADFKHLGTRELKAEDYIYEIKRLADPSVNSPIYGLMSEYIEGFRAFGEALPPKNIRSVDFDLRKVSLDGVKKINEYTYSITLKGTYPQFKYWLAMPFFAPIPWEAEQFYSQPGMEDKNLSFGWFPVGTGPFMLIENNPNRQMILQKNPNYHPEHFPKTASKEDISQGYLHHPGKKLPLIEKAIFTLEKEAIPRWNKFLQGYYDLSGISADSFDQAIQMTRTRQAALTPTLKAKGMRLTQMTDPSIFYLGFNMLDPVVGGKSERARKLRQAISIAINYEENIAIFFNGRGTPAQGPIPPGIFGYLEGKAGINSYVYTWNGRQAIRRPIEDAKKLMKEAGYLSGKDPKTNRALILNYDVPASGGPDDKAQLNWMRKQFAKIGISLNIRATQYNRFQEKMRNGNAQIFTWGWNADYPDPENFLFLLYGPNGKVKHGGENAANYSSAVYDKLFEQMKYRSDDETRQKIINQMIDRVRRDAPWVFGVNTKSLVLSQQWVAPFKPNTMSQNTLKYMAIDVPLRNQLRTQWNRPIFWPIALFIVVLSLLLLPFLLAYFKKQNQKARRTS